MDEGRPEPVRWAMIPSAIIVGVLAGLIAWGQDGGSGGVAVAFAAAAAAQLGVGKLVRGAVTPMKDPRDHDGTPLVRADDPPPPRTV